LTDAEKDWVRRAKNVSAKTARKQDQALHRHATALEALVGWWSVHDPSRMELLTPYWADAMLPLVAGVTLETTDEERI
jgi:23S rRNA maturation mini-RNase III